MRVARDRIRGVDSGEVAAEAWRDDGGTAPRGIDVKPQLLRLAETCQIRKGIDHAGCRGADRPDHHEWREPASPILGHSSREISEIHLQIAIRCDHAQRPAAQSRHLRDLGERVMGLVRQIDRRRCGQAPKPAFAIVRKRARQRDDDRREIRLRSAIREARDGTRREAELPRQPRERVPFDLVGRRRGTPARQLRVVHRDKRVCDDRRKRHARIEESEVPRMRHLHLPCSQHPFDVGADIVQGH